MNAQRSGHSSIGVGDRIGGYRVEAIVGHGSVGEVVRAVGPSDTAPVAIKVLRSELADDPVARRRLLHEARHATRLNHPNLLSVLDVVDDGNLPPYLVMEYLPAGSLADLLRAGGPLPIRRALVLAVDLAGGLDALRSEALVHRDIKPANVLFRADGTAVLTDFGFALGSNDTRLTGHGQVVGTLDYLAPELIRGEAASPTSDIYAFGCVMFECLTGRPPFGDRRALEVAKAHLEAEPPDASVVRPEIPAALAWAAARALAKDPAERPPTALTYARLLAAAAPM
jgi:eukaryotic-like serine/threonine-protein kinase